MRQGLEPYLRHMVDTVESMWLSFARSSRWASCGTWSRRRPQLNAKCNVPCKALNAAVNFP